MRSGAERLQVPSGGAQRRRGGGAPLLVLDQFAPQLRQVALPLLRGQVSTRNNVTTGFVILVPVYFFQFN